MKCTCRGATPNPECNYDHASENGRIDALRRELSLLPKFVAEALQCLDMEAVAASFLSYTNGPYGADQKAGLGHSMDMHIGDAIDKYAHHCISNWSETRLCDTGDEAAILRTLIARYQ